MWFSFDGESFTTHETREEAQKDAQNALEDCRSDAFDGWPEQVYRICWGQVIENATVVVERPRTEDDCVDKNIDTIQEIELRGEYREYRCNICGGVVRFDGTPPGK